MCTGNPECVLVLLFINFYIIFHMSSCDPSFTHRCVTEGGSSGQGGFFQDMPGLHSLLHFGFQTNAEMSTEGRDE